MLKVKLNQVFSEFISLRFKLKILSRKLSIFLFFKMLHLLIQGRKLMPNLLDFFLNRTEFFLIVISIVIEKLRFFCRVKVQFDCLFSISDSMSYCWNTISMVLVKLLRSLVLVFHINNFIVILLICLLMIFLWQKSIKKN